jgi:hypothetical protein
MKETKTMRSLPEDFRLSDEQIKKIAEAMNKQMDISILKYFKNSGTQPENTSFGLSGIINDKSKC